MEDVLEVYHRARDPKRPLVCLDEASRQLIGETRVALPAIPGVPRRYDCEYKRNGTANLFMIYAPLEGWRHVEVTERRTAVDWAHCVRKLVDEIHPQAEKIVLVEDNLNIHQLGSLYEAFGPAEARRIAEKLELHFTPKHGSWLNMAEVELSILQRQCLKQRIADRQTMKSTIKAWQTRRNAQGAGTHWQFTIDDARTKLHRLYPSNQSC